VSSFTVLAENFHKGVREWKKGASGVGTDRKTHQNKNTFGGSGKDGNVRKDLNVCGRWAIWKKGHGRKKEGGTKKDYECKGGSLRVLDQGIGRRGGTGGKFSVHGGLENCPVG